MLSTCGILVLATVFLYWVLVQSLDGEGVQFGADMIHVLRGILRAHPSDLTALEEEVQAEVAARQYIKYYVRVLNAQRETLLETLHMGGRLPPHVFPSPIGPQEQPLDGLKWRAGQGRVYYLVTAWSQVGHDAEALYLLQIGLDISRRERLLAHYRHQLILTLMVGMVLSASAAVLVARRGMRPLVNITQAAQRVTATQLHERIGPVAWPRELLALTTTFDAMLDRLEDAFTRLTQFAADLAHELRTPINNLMGEAEVALSRSRSPAEYQQVLESSLEEYGRLARLIESVLFLARADSPEMCLHYQTLDVRKECDTVLAFHEAVAEDAGVAVRCAGSGSIQADPLLFAWAVSNLLANALQYTPHGGQVVLAVTTLPDRSTTLCISDTGTGIAPEHVPHLFERFYRADPARSPARPGMGLGLAIVQSIMTLHHGTVTLESVLGHGTTVTLTFPPPCLLSAT
jgi:two-component system heavy metal sensor histidine kinase CusS